MLLRTNDIPGEGDGMTAQLSGRALELAVATAIGWFDPLALIPQSTLFAPHYLSSPIAFASVLAAITGAQLFWEMSANSAGGGWARIIQPGGRDWIGVGDTYQEAMCRAFVAWKQEGLAPSLGDKP